MKAITKSELFEALQDLPDEALVYVSDINGEQCPFELYVRTDPYQEAELMLPINIENYYKENK